MADSIPARVPASRGGRPLKFREKSKAVTLTLPERILGLLTTIDTDRARAVVKATDAMMVRNRHLVEAHVELIEVLPGMGMIVMQPCRSLESLPWLHMAEMAPGRNILVLKAGTSVEKLEIEILEMLEQLPPETRHERPVLEKLRTVLGSLRRGGRISRGEVILFRTDGRKAG